MARRGRDRFVQDDASAAWMQAIRADDTARAQALLAAPPGPNALVRLPDGEFPALILAIEQPAPEVAILLIERGAELNGSPNPLAVALHNDQGRIAEALLARGARLAVELDAGLSLPPILFHPAIGCAGAKGRGFALLEGLIAPARVQGVDVNAMLRDVVAEAIREDDPEALREAVRVGARLDDPELLGAALQRAPATLRAVLQLGSYPPELLRQQAARVIWNNHHACENMKVLASQGISPRSYGEEALVIGCHYDRGDGRPELDAYEYLLKAGVSPNARGGEPLKGALGLWTGNDPDWNCDRELAALLIRYGADLSVLPKEARRIVQERLGLK